MSCADDLTVDDLTNSVSTAVLERVSAGEGSNTNLYNQIDRDNVVGVNIDIPGSAPKVIKAWDERLIEEGIDSGVDDEVILHIPFISSIRLRTLLLLPPPPSHPHRPHRLRLYPNLPHCPDFSDLDSLTPLMDIDITSPQHITRGLGGIREVEEWGLKVQNLASVFSVTLVFSEAGTGQRSSVWYVGFKGDPKVAQMDMSKLGRVAAQDAADKPVDEVAEKKGSGYTTIR